MPIRIGLISLGQIGNEDVGVGNEEVANQQTRSRGRQEYPANGGTACPAMPSGEAEEETHGTRDRPHTEIEHESQEWGVKRGVVDNAPLHKKLAECVGDERRRKNQRNDDQSVDRRGIGKPKVSFPFARIDRF